MNEKLYNMLYNNIMLLFHKADCKHLFEIKVINIMIFLFYIFKANIEIKQVLWYTYKKFKIWQYNIY